MGKTSSWWWPKKHSPEDKYFMLRSRITSKRFMDMFDDPRVGELLERMGVTATDPHHYIEAMDANGDGQLSASELVRGLLKLRGSVEKADIVAGLVVAQDMQQSVKNIEAIVMRQNLHHSEPVEWRR